MPEVIAVLSVVLLSVLGFVVLRFQINSQPVNPGETLAHLQQRHAWLQDRLATAREENWDADMIAGLNDQLTATARELARAGQRAA